MVELKFAKCPVCGAEVSIPRKTAFKAKCTAGGAVGGMIAGGTAGAIYGTGTGIAAGGTAIAGTVPIGVVGGAIGGLALGIAGRLGAEWALARVTCTAGGCKTSFRI
jgi:hypothetical protein